MVKGALIDTVCLILTPGGPRAVDTPRSSHCGNNLCHNFCGSIKDVRQLLIKTFSLQLLAQCILGLAFLELSMTTISIASTRSIADTKDDDHSLKTIALFCFFGLATSLCLVTFGIDLGIGWL
jgi:hypothetical protein